MRCAAVRHGWRPGVARALYVCTLAFGMYRAWTLYACELSQLRISRNSLRNLSARSAARNFAKFTVRVRSDRPGHTSTRTKRPIPLNCAHPRSVPAAHGSVAPTHILWRRVHLAVGRWRGRRRAVGGGAKGRWCNVYVCMCGRYVYVWACSCIGPRAARHEKMCVVGAKFARNLQW